MLHQMVPRTHLFLFELWEIKKQIVLCTWTRKNSSSTCFCLYHYLCRPVHAYTTLLTWCHRQTAQFAASQQRAACVNGPQQVYPASPAVCTGALSTPRQKEGCASLRCRPGLPEHDIRLVLGPRGGPGEPGAGAGEPPLSRPEPAPGLVGQGPAAAARPPHGVCPPAVHAAARLAPPVQRHRTFRGGLDRCHCGLDQWWVLPGCQNPSPTGPRPRS